MADGKKAAGIVLGIAVVGGITAAVLLSSKASGGGGEDGGGGSEENNDIKVDLYREFTCKSAQGGECIDWWTDERELTITVENKGPAGLYTLSAYGLRYQLPENTPSGSLFGPEEWDMQMASGGVATHRVRYNIPTTGMSFDSHYFITVTDAAGIVIFDAEIVIEGL